MNVDFIVDLYCGLGGWAEGFLREGFDVIGFDIERRPYPGQLVIQDVLTLHGSQFRHAAGIVASPPCQEPSYRAMPWSRAKKLNAAGPPVKFMALFEACFRIRREACEAAGRYIPIVVENVVGAQRWVGRARWHYGSYYLWGDVLALMPKAFGRKFPAHCGSWKDREVARLNDGDSLLKHAASLRDGVKAEDPDYGTRGWFGPNGGTNVEWVNSEGIKHHDSGAAWWRTSHGQFGSRSEARKAASALIAKIPFPLANHIARCWKQGALSSSSEPQVRGGG